MPESGFGRTRWRRFGVLMVASGVMTGGMLAMVANGALAVTFSVSGQQFKVGAKKLEATGFAQYGSVDQIAVRGKPNDPTYKPIVVAVMKDAKLTKLCQSVVTDLGAIGGYWTLKITAGADNPSAQSDDGKVLASDMLVDMSQLDGTATFKGMEIGRDASNLDKVAPVSSDDKLERAQAQSFFGQQADTVVIDNLQQTAYTTTAGSFFLPSMHLELTPGKNECF